MILENIAEPAFGFEKPTNPKDAPDVVEHP